MTPNQISTATNIVGPDLSAASSLVDARKYFNNFYSVPFNVSADVDNALVAFFEEYTPNRVAAKNLAGAVLYTALAQNLNPLTVLSEFKNLPTGQLNNYLVAFLNVNRAPTSVLGINNGTKTSPYITRTILL
jgi:hypothetical protein